MVLATMALIAGAILTGWGLAHLSWKGALPWGLGGLVRYSFFLLICAWLLTRGALWSKRSPLFIGIIVAVGIAFLTGALWPLLVTLWFAIASALLGKHILETLRVRLVTNSWLTSLLVGAGVIGTVVGLLAHFPVNYPALFVFLLALPVLLNRRALIEQASRFTNWVTQTCLVEQGTLRLDATIAAVSLIYFVVALMPEIGFDALAMHLFIPAHLAQRHQWGFDASTYVWAVMPMLGDWIFSIGYMLAGETAARLINIGFIFILCWLIRDIVLWACGSVIGARWAVIIFLSTPLTFTEGSSLFIESVWASFVLSGTLAILRTSTTPSASRHEVSASGLLLGLALASKAVTFSILPALILLYMWQYRSRFKEIHSPSLILGTSLFLVTGLIPYVTAWWLTGNPVFPFFNGIFQSPYYPAVNFDSSSTFGKGLSWDILYHATFESGKYLEARSGASGFQWLLLLLPAPFMLLATKQRKGLILFLLGLAVITLVFQSVSYFRYVFPAWALFAATIGVALSSALSDQSGIWKYWRAAAVSSVALNLLFLNAGANYSDFALMSIPSETTKNTFLQDRQPIRNAIELVNRLNTGQKPVAIFSYPLGAGLVGDALYPNWYNSTFQREIASIQNEQELRNILLQRGVDFIILDSNWNGRGCCANGAETRALIEISSVGIWELRSISVRRVKADYHLPSTAASSS